LYWREKVELKALTSRSCSTGKQYDKSTLILFDEILGLCKKAKSKKKLVKHKDMKKSVNKGIVSISE